MKRIYKNNDLAFNLTINNFPINKGLINSIEFRFYTLNNNNYISKSESDIDAYNQVILQWDELKKLEEGVLYYDYTVSLNNDDMVDGTQDTVNKKMTNYYIVTGIDNINIDNNIDSTKYYTKDEVDELINDVVVGTIDLTEYYNKTEVDALISNIEHPTTDLTNYYKKDEVDYKLEGYVEDGDLGSYYTKNEVNDLIDGIAIPPYEPDLSDYYTKDEVDDKFDKIVIGDTDYDLSNYYTKSEVDSMIPSTEGFITEIPSEYITESELTAKGYLTEHQSLDNYYTKTEVDNKINNSGNFDSTQYYTKTEVDAKIPTDYITSIPSEYITENELTAKGYLTEHQSLDGYAKLTDIPTDYIKTIPSEYITETELNTSLNGYSITSHTHSEYITEQYDDTELTNRVSALETELNGVSQQITELNNMVV